MDPPNDARYTDDDSGSPTQVNEGRSYDRYADAPELPSMPLQDPDDAHDQSRLGGLLDRSLDENDTGAVHFDSLDSGGLDFESPSMTDDGRRTGRPTTRFFLPNSDNESPLAPAARGLETPAPPKNPFAAAKNLQTPLLGGTQLFAQTPLSAAARKPASPTSSRPSPTHLLAAMPYAGVSSPLKLQFLTSDNEATTPAPNLSVLLATSSQSRFDATTPFPADPARSTAGPLSSPSVHRRTQRRTLTRTPTLLAEYEPMRQSQARRNAAELQPEPANQDFGASSSEDDVEDASQRRRRIVRQKREEGAKMLSSINIAGPSFRQDTVEVPASTKKAGCEQRPRSKGRLERARSCGSEALLQNKGLRHRDVMSDTGEQNPAKEVPLSGSETTYGDVSFPQSLMDAFNTKTDTLPATKTPTSSAVSLPEMGLPGDGPEGVDARPLRSSLNRAEAIPETSPAITRRKEDDAAIVISSAANGPSQVIDENHEPILVPASDDVQQHDLLPPQRRTSRSRSPRAQDQKHNHANLNSSWRNGLVQDSEADGTTSSPPVLAAQAFDRRPRKMQRRGDVTGDQTPARPRAAKAASTSSSTTGGTVSSLSSLSNTPTPPSREETPTTVNDSDMSALGSEKKQLIDSVEQQDDIVPQTRQSRRQHSAAASLRKGSASRNSSMASLASTKRRASPFLSGTASNRSASPATTLAPEQSVCTGRRSVARSMASHKTNPSSFISTRRQNPAVPGVFTGMAFAISFQSRRTRGPERETDKEFYDREQQSKVLSKRIQEAGGRVLEDGFAELFDAPPVETAADDDDDDDAATCRALQLRPTAAATGFTALIADGHSRKTKYMQALALGLPCLAARWVTTCLELNTLVDWQPYLLCAGQSSFLGGAFCSQKVAPYDAATARLAQVVSGSSNSSSGSGCGARRLMEGMSVLLVLLRSHNGRGQQQHPPPHQQQQKEEESRAAPYIFLTHVLGARLSRVAGADKARRALLAREQAGRPFDWVYTDGEGDNGAYYDAAAPLDELPAKAKSKPKPLAGAKRKRAAGGRSSNSATTAAPVPRPVKLLSNERVIQSLIFGKFIEQDQLGA